MDFFAQQDKARKNTGILLLYFFLAILATVLLVYFLPLYGLHIYRGNTAPPGTAPLGWWYPEVFMWVCGGTLMVILTGASLKIIELRQGGGRMVAEMLGGKEILPNTDDFFERRLRNVVEEMAIASGTPVPPVYVMQGEKGINAFAAGFTVSDSVVAVTYGTMTGLTRDELQGVVAHEFSHVLNNDMAMNIRLMGILHGLLMIALAGQLILRVGVYSGGGRDRKGGGIPILAIAICLIIVGYVGVLCANLIKASVSRSRERLADASAVQFTRNPAGLASALKKIGGLSYGSRMRNPRATETSHMFFGSGV
ncbi:MAG: M48 family metalloprotease, partial [Kiritimatiellaceae bacterium]|nr:M48 family metalloprotease [Kiritimatiellaceae bacterium]